MLHEVVIYKHAKLSLCFIKDHTVKVYGEVAVCIHAF